jgi:predicted nicotinamide N-methyase
MWPSAVALSRWLVSNPTEVQNVDILELGAGCGLTGLVAARLKAIHGEIEGEAPSVTLTDFNPTVMKNIEQNIRLNGLQGVARGIGLDFYKQDVTVDGWLDTNGDKREQVDLVLAADVICQPDDAFAAARSIFCSLRPGGKAIVVSADPKHRFGVERFEEACVLVGLRVSRTNVKDLHQGRLLSSNMEKTSSYVDGMTLTMYTVDKVCQ